MFFLRPLARPIASQTNFTARRTVFLVGRQSQRWQMKLNNAPRAAPYSSGGGLSREEVEARVLDVFRGFEKVNPNKVSKHVESSAGRIAHYWTTLMGQWGADETWLFLQLTPTARFKEDLALDSLDAVEVVMAVEEVGDFSGWRAARP